MKKVLLEGLWVAFVGTTVAFLANAFSPRGLTLNRDYFHLASPQPSGNAVTNHAASRPRANSPEELLAASLKAVNLNLLGSNEVLHLFHDPRREQDLVIFVDAREADHYEAGHIPGAFEFHHFHPENSLATTIPACQIAQQIVVYCNGGNCDESKFAALTLRDYLSDVSKTNLFIYGGGMTEWTTNHLPVELGERNSGRLLDPDPAAAPRP